MNWDKVCRLGEVAGQSQSSLAGNKRSSMGGSTEDTKKGREGLSDSE